jgi:hypothetical protein
MAEKMIVQINEINKPIKSDIIDLFLNIFLTWCSTIVLKWKVVVSLYNPFFNHLFFLLYCIKRLPYIKNQCPNRVHSCQKHHQVVDTQPKRNKHL